MHHDLSGCIMMSEIRQISRCFSDEYTKIARRGGKAVIIFISYNAPDANLGRSLVDVTQSLTQGVHQLIDDILVHNTICRDRRGELREGSLTEQGLIKRLRTFMKGGPPVGKTGSPLGMATEPPANDQKLAGLAFCQSYQSLSTIWGKRYVRKSGYSHLSAVPCGAS